MRPELHKKLKETLISTFYCEAPVPCALNLTKTNCQKTRDYVSIEIDAALKSGCSAIYTNTYGNDAIMRVALNLTWQRNDKYEVIGADAKSWHNAAAEIVHNDINISERHLQWRNYQFQHIYDMGQKLLQQVPEKKYAFYYSIGCVYPGFRERGISSTSLTSDISRLDGYHVNWDLSECIIYFMTSFPKMNTYMQTQPGKYKLIDYVSYAEENLILEGKKCFEPFEKLGGLTYYVNFNMT